MDLYVGATIMSETRPFEYGGGHVIEDLIRGREEDRPQTRLDRMAGSVPGMSVSVGRVRHGVDERSLRFVVLGHNTIRGAAGGAISLAELLSAEGWID